MILKCCVLLLCGILLVCADDDAPTVQTPNGRIQGVRKQTGSRMPYLKFQGIPYARPPVGKRRFAPPKPMKPWSGTWVANASHTCIQVDHYDEPNEGRTNGEEDCLYLNVYAPGQTINPEANLDVIVHIHGGGFMFGSAHYYAHPTALMTKNVVFVAMNYRVGIFGFMSLEDAVLPGNNGMRDQVMALQWIQDNIRYFGGNPNSVTITGVSAGGASVHCHMLSPLSKGLFHKAISASGNALDPWAIHEAPRHKAKQVGRAVGCPYEDSKQFLGCLRTRPAFQIVETTKLFRDWIYLPFSPFGLVVDSSAEQPFLPEHPYKMLKAGLIQNVPWIASLTTAEGLYPVAQLAARQEYFDEFAKNFEKHLPPTLHYDMSVPYNKLNEVTKKIRHEYLGDKEIGKCSYSEIIKMASDRLFNVGMEESIRLHSKAIKSPVYFYLYDYTHEQIWSLPQLLLGYNDKYGVSHADDILIIFEAPMQLSENDTKIQDILVNMWVDFAKNGQPGRADWIPVSDKPDETLDYLYIHSPASVEMRKTKDLGNKVFWNSLPIIENGKLFAKPTKGEL